MLDITLMGDEVLREKCQPVTKFDDGLRILVDAMYETLEEADGVGLAGPQVDVPSRLFVIAIKDEVKKTFVNPQIVQTSMEECVMEEGCLSVPGVWHDVSRPSKVTIQAQDVDGKPFTITADGLYARAIQHEFDHLNGVLFIDHLSPEEKEKMVLLFKKKNRKALKSKRKD